MTKNSSQNKKSNTKPIRHSGSFKLRWKSGIVIILVVAVLGIVIVRFSRAALPPEALADKTEQLLADGRYKVSVPSLGYEKIFNQLDVARAQADPSFRAQMEQKVLEELEALYIQKHPTQPSPVAAPTASSTPTESTSTTTTTTPTDNPTQNITSTDPAVEAIKSVAVDAKEPSTLPEYSGVVAFTYPASKAAGAKTAKVYVDRGLVQEMSARKNTFNIDTTRLPNNQHRLDVVLIDSSGKETVHYVYPFKSNNKPTIFRYLSNSITYPWTVLFGQ